jgi:hypothetical protein
MNKIFKKISLVIIFFVFIIPLSAVDFQGIIFADYYGDIEPGTSYENLRSRLYFQPVLSGSLFNYTVDFELSGKLYYDPLGDPFFIEPENILKEAYLFLPAGNFDFSIGQKILSPGMVDVFSPLNNINSEYINKLSLDDPYDSRRADLMFQLQYYPNFNDSIQFVYVPFPRPDYEESRAAAMVSADINVDFIFETDPYLTDNGHSFFVSYNHMSSSFDLQLNYAYYTEQTPDFDLSELDAGASLTGNVFPLYTKKHTFGGAYSTSFNGITLVEELAVNLTEDLDGSQIGVKNSDITLNSQITGTLFGGTFAQLNIIYQYVINYDQGDPYNALSVDDQLIDEFNNYFNQPVQNIAFFIGHLHNSYFREKLYLALNIGFFFSTDIYLAPRIAYAFSDGMKIEAGADIKTDEPSEYALARGNLSDNYYVRLKYEY